MMHTVGQFRTSAKGRSEQCVGSRSDPVDARLFVTMAGVMIFSLFPDLVQPNIAKQLRTAMHTACCGNKTRAGGVRGDDMYPSYTNVSV